jgi:hypothetical protein
LTSRFNLIAIALFLFICGCGETKEKVYPTEGRLLIGGKPAANVFVLFNPVNGKQDAKRPSATTDMEGRFQLTTIEALDGGPAGDYTVTLLYEPVSSPLTRAKGKPPQIPATYNKVETSPLKAKIEAKAKNEIEVFKLP